MSKRPILAVLAATALAVTISSADASCVEKFNFCAGCSVDVSMHVKSGKVCTLTYHALGGVYGQQIVLAPKHGKYGTANETATAYFAHTGYAGPDYFEARLFYELASGKRTFTLLRVNVDVKPAGARS